jgi:DNA-binding MarR family transcriptional regulator
MLDMATEQWIELTKAAQRLGISQAKLSSMVKRGEVKSKKDIRDKRKTFVDLNELNRLFYPQE